MFLQSSSPTRLLAAPSPTISTFIPPKWKPALLTLFLSTPTPVICQQKCTLRKHNVASQILHNFSHEPFFHCISVIQIHGQLLELVNRNPYPCQNSKFIHSTFQHPTPSFLFISFSISAVKNSSPSLNLLTYWFCCNPTASSCPFSLDLRSMYNTIIPLQTSLTSFAPCPVTLAY